MHSAKRTTDFWYNVGFTKATMTDRVRYSLVWIPFHYDFLLAPLLMLAKHRENTTP